MWYLINYGVEYEPTMKSILLHSIGYYTILMTVRRFGQYTAYRLAFSLPYYDKNNHILF